MSSIKISSLLPEFAAEQATTESARSELAALLAKLSSLETPDSGDLTRGRNRLLAAVSESSERYAPLFGKLTQFFDLSAEALRDVFARASRESEWEPGPLPWVSLFHFAGGPSVAGLDTGFVRFKKGTPFPPHRHLGTERVLILSGGYHDHEQRYYGPGDFHEMLEGTEHSLQMTDEQDVLLAVIMSADIQVVGG